ncbi:hypothetical protein [Undibacterium curvum]|uniref:hypothetical protein n=1 Tax=Undibacterium curvum TaxID=2762294 RepID=UPI003D11F511
MIIANACCASRCALGAVSSSAAEEEAITTKNNEDQQEFKRPTCYSGFHTAHLDAPYQRLTPYGLVVGCVYGAPSMAFGLANVSEAADWVANGNETVDGRHPVKQALMARGLSAQTADTVTAFGEVASAGALLNAPVKVLEGGKWIDVLPGRGGYRVTDRSTYAPLSQTRGALSEAAGAAWDAWSPLFSK